MRKTGFVIGLVLVLISITSCQEDLSAGTSADGIESEKTSTSEMEKAEDQTDSTQQADQSTETDTPAQKDNPAQSDFSGEYGILPNGDLEIRVDRQTTVLQINALPDSQIIEDERRRLLILTGPTDRYRHSILGDDLEATSVALVQITDQPEVINTFSVPDEWVIESILPIWSDWDEDGEREILLTLSNDMSGAKLALYDEVGNLMAESRPIGKGFRWRHALTIAAFGSNGQRLLAEVQTPHIGGVVGFYSWSKEKKSLELTASISGYSTHDIGSRDMHMYALFEDEQTGKVSLILPTQSKTEVVALRLVQGEIYEEWRIPLGGRLMSDIELIDGNGRMVIHGIVDGGQEVLLDLPE